MPAPSLVLVRAVTVVQVFPPSLLTYAVLSNWLPLKLAAPATMQLDQFNLLYGARRFVRRLNELGIAHRYEEFPDNHTGVDYRMDESLPFLAQGLSG